MSETVYVESSVISYLTARPSRDIVVSARQAITENWWKHQRSEYELFISGLVVQEISKGNEEAARKRLAAIAGIPLLSMPEEVLGLAKNLLAQGSVPPNSEEDAFHIAIAAVSGINFLLTWNFKHINNAHTKALISSAVEAHGFICPVLCSPEELGEKI
ncbi:MAG: type II toxin-antitoxin system VapC family toxin [Pseudomonadota bacterium]